VQISQANALLLTAALLGVVFFAYFFKLMSSAPEQRALLVGSKPGKLINFAVTVPLILLLVLGPQAAKIWAAAALFPVMLFITWRQHRWLLAHGAQPAFVRRLSVVSVIGGIAMAVLVGAMVAGA
jgi:hypothetical protein